MISKLPTLAILAMFWTCPASGQDQLCQERWSLGPIAIGSSGTELKQLDVLKPENPRDMSTLTTMLDVGGLRVETDVGFCLDDKGEVTTIAASFAKEDIDPGAVLKWLQGRYGPLVELRRSCGERSSYIEAVVFDSCFRHAVIAYSDTAAGITVVHVTLARGLPSFVSLSVDSGLQIDHNAFDAVMWRYAFCKNPATPANRESP